MTRPIGDLDINLLLALDALLQDQNVTHAAARLNITQSALSGRLTRLRRIFNDPLFVPSSSGRGMTPTSHTLALKPELQRLLQQLTQFVQSAHVFDPATSERTFRIAAMDNPAAILAPALLPLISAQAPAVRVAFTLPDKTQVNGQLERGEVDLFIGTAQDAAPNLIGRLLFNEEFLTAQRIGHPRGTGPLSLDTFCELDHLLISTSGGMFNGMIDEALADLGRQRRVTVSVQSYALAPLILNSTDCICTLPKRFLQRFTSHLELFTPPLTLDTFSMKLFWHSTVNADPAHRWLRSMIFDAVQTN
ncbi:DNA-binding transcriptional LysR family regulator [Advenella incenata]|jgi:DNA-binding transcriptional LysR family regulator|uniref:DNA-binding transcriptional LysR family regulator n=1 Tax=Advenella incenata TaxID=267800 RepID=A0A4Q7VQF1_9BURK|nr:LysR family transcriptional regulator [Advenella incenata]RZT98418.1 DNA-binding transcriptional LysR family regulator [Advenella incenata]